MSSLSLQSAIQVPAAPESHTNALANVALHSLDGSCEPEAREVATDAAAKAAILPGTMSRLVIARSRIHDAARGGQRIRTYEVALDLDMSEFHFARQFRLAFERSPHVYYDEVRADTARQMLASGMSEGVVARKIGFRRPAELRALLQKRPAGTLPPELSR